MRNIIRGLTGSLAAVGLAVGGAAITAPTASADSGSCADWLSRGSLGSSTHVSITTKGNVTFTTAAPSATLCAGMTVSIGISRPNNRDFRNQLATRAHWEGNAYLYLSTFALDRYDVGDWMTRQIAVKDRTGKLAVRTFTQSNTPQVTRVQYASVLPGTPTGTLRPSATGVVPIRGSLKAWHYSGRLINLQNQRVIVQVKRPGNYAYTTVTSAVTSRTGTFAVNAKLSAHRGKDVRIGFVSGIPIIAQDFTYLGRVR